MPPKPTPQGSKKRKRNTSTHTSSPSVRKKGKNRSIVAESPATADDSEVIWQVRAIINERKVGRRIQYLLDWEPNSQTGETFSPTWQFSKDVGDGSIQEWNDEKERRERQQKPQSGSVSSQPQRTDNFTEAGPHLSEPAQHVQRQGRQRRVVNSSSPQPASTPPRQGGPASPEVQETPFFGPTEIGLTPLREPPSTLNPEEPTGLPIPQVHVTTTSGFNRDDYLVGLSQALQSSDPPPASSGVREPSSPPPIEVRTVIPDSQGVTTLSSVDTTQARSLDAPSPQPLVEELTGSLLPDQPVEALTDKAGRPVLQSSVAVFETDPVEVSSSAIVSEALPDQTGSRVSSPSSVQAPTEKTESPNFQEAQVRDSPVIESLTTNENSQSREIASPAPNTAETHSPLSINPSTNPTHTFSQQLREQFQSTILVTPGSDLKTTLPSAELSTSSAPQPPDFDTYPAQHTDIPEEMPETRRSLRASAPSSGTSGSPARTAPSTPNSVKNSRSIRAEDNARRKEREEKQQRESAALKEKEQQEKEAREAEEEAAAALSTSDSQLSENPISAIPADEAVDEPTVLQDAQDGSKLPDRLPSDAADKAMDSTSENGFTDGAARSEPSASESDPEETPGLALEQMEFIVPLPFSSQARDQYRRTVKYKEPLVERITGQNWSHDPSTVPDAELFVQTMRNIATHIDLTNVTTSSQGPVDPVLSMRWDCSVSTKFKFLGYLLNDLRGQSLHVVIICQPGEIVSILERFLQGNKISYSRTDAIANQSSPIASSSLKVTLRPATGEGSDTVLPPANLLLTLDHFIDINEPQIRALRQHPSYEQLAPVISLAVVNSVDHIERSLMPSLVGLKRLRVLVRCIAKTRKDAGKHDPGRPSIEDSAMEVARFVSMRGSQDTWPLPDIGPFDNNDAWDLSQGLVTMKSAGSSDSGDAKTKAVQKNVQKRRLEHVQDDAAESSKKIRMTPQGDNDASTTRISDSMVGGSSQAHKTPTHPNETASLRALLKATEERLQETRKAKDEELLSYQTALSDLQFRFEAQTAEKRSLASELTETKRIIVSIQNQNEVGIASIESFKETTRDLRERLAEARRALETSAIPEIAAMEKLRQEKEKAEEARAKAEKDKASQDSLNKYLAENYSLASTRAAELGQENEEYAAKNMALEKTASGEIVKVRQMYHSEQQKRLQSENIRLKQEVKNMSSLLQRKEEEHRNRKPGVGTRAGSVPRSPRVGPASRAGSPIPDRRIGVLKNNMNL
ncbi:hypothetical protein EJ08DRAFT_353621 [Tothia fuscella]|uniref:Chromo domain-containing protein n=1 Tax=Tothia fuscella TaxID=1048955 RepID=A0A9P4NME9_9PEZI|nr:hypothetical protein EJ08DRAFT_353621 [Tothia fuscella]